MPKNYILFDLDGTIIDPKEGITKSVQYALADFGIHAEADGLLHFIGPSLWDSFKQFYGFDAEQTKRAVAKYRERFTVTGILENTLYDGMKELLQALHDTGKTLIIATSKPAVFAERILAHYGIDQYFAFVSGSELDGRRSHKDELITYAFENVPVGNLINAVMIGDREFDIIGANQTGIDSIGVLYGYGDLQELTDIGATHIVQNVRDLHQLLLPRA